MKIRPGVVVLLRLAIPFGLLASIVVGASLTAPLAYAWGCKGHQSVALIAEKHLTAEAQEFVFSLLTANPIDPQLKRYCGTAVNDALGDASTWADDVRADRKNGPWHYIDIPRGASNSPLERFCGSQGCVVSAIREQVAILKDQSADGRQRADALRYIIHFVGDLHQPLHSTTNADEGGNCLPLKYFRREPHGQGHGFAPNLHSVWDSAILERDAEGADPAEYADTLVGLFASSIEAWQKAGIHVDDWVWESHEYAESNAYGSLTPKVSIEPNVAVHTCTDDNHIGQRLLQQHITAGEAYQQQAAAVVRRRVAQAGIRLALILNDAAKTQHDSTKTTTP